MLGSYISIVLCIPGTLPFWISDAIASDIQNLKVLIKKEVKQKQRRRSDFFLGGKELNFGFLPLKGVRRKKIQPKIGWLFMFLSWRDQSLAPYWFRYDPELVRA